MTKKAPAQDEKEEKQEEVLSLPLEIFIPPLYMPARWAGVLDTLRCTTCGHCDPDQENMILHVLNHVPENERDEMLEKLLKAKE